MDTVIENKRKVLIVAPHFNFPPMDGADKTIEAFFEVLDGFEIFLLYSEGLYNVTTSELIIEHRLKRRPKYLAAIFSIYNKETYSAALFNRSEILGDFSFYAVIYSYLGNLYKYKEFIKAEKSLVWTHNYDIDWYSYKKSQNCALNIVNFFNRHSTVRYLQNLNKDTYLIACSEYDHIQYSRWHSRTVKVGIGVDLINHDNIGKARARNGRSLAFVGSLGNRMNLDALVYFDKHFWPGLVAEGFRFSVVGSNPSKAIIDLVERNSWMSYYNVASEDFDSTMDNFDFFVMPFEYNNGFKLKQLLSLKYRKPILATKAIELIDSGIGVTSDSLVEWLSYVESFSDNYAEFISSVDAKSKEYSWENQLYPMITILK